MMFPRFTFAATVALLLGVASADLAVLAPGGPDLWWVADSINTVVWTCQDSSSQNFTVLIANSNPSVLTSPAALIAIEYNYDCSKSITASQADFNPATGYTVQLANPLNNTDVYAESQPFEIKALGAAYPASTATPTATGSSAASGSSASSTSSSSPSSNKSNGAADKKASVLVGGLALMAAVIGLM